MRLVLVQVKSDLVVELALLIKIELVTSIFSDIKQILAGRFVLFFYSINIHRACYFSVSGQLAIFTKVTILIILNSWSFYKYFSVASVLYLKLLAS